MSIPVNQHSSYDDSSKYLFYFSGYAKGGPCPSTDTWLFYLDRGHWERLWECPTTKTGAALVTLPSYSVCAAMGQGIYSGVGGAGMGEEPVAVLWGGREQNPSSIRVRIFIAIESILIIELIICLDISKSTTRSSRI